jgi:hypothetical protein
MPMSSKDDCEQNGGGKDHNLILDLNASLLL